jgi:hypothetical protein
MKIFTLTMVFLLVAGAAFPADFDGRWSGQLTSPYGIADCIFTLKSNGSELTGILIRGSGISPETYPSYKANVNVKTSFFRSLFLNRKIALKKGKIEGNAISFKTSEDMGENTVKINYKGILSDDVIKLSIDVENSPPNRFSKEIMLSRSPQNDDQSLLK